MKTKIKYNDLNDLSKYIIDKSKEIDSIFQDISKLINSVDNIWTGKDSRDFIDVATTNINMEINNNKKLKKYGEDLAVIANDYKELENSFNDQIKKETVDNG